MTKKAPSPLEILTRNFVADFAEMLEKERAGKQPAQDIARALIRCIFEDARQCFDEREVRKWFGQFGPQGSREQSQHRRAVLVTIYAREGKPPKKTFAREMAQLNARLIEAGKLDELVGSGTSDPDLMYDYLKKTLRVEKNRRKLESRYAMYQELQKEQGGVKVFEITPWGKHF